ncbi:MAG: hypothetical protein R2715_13460 [Ilumatobacteraceae bacterium]
MATLEQRVAGLRQELFQVDGLLGLASTGEEMIRAMEAPLGGRGDVVRAWIQVLEPGAFVPLHRARAGRLTREPVDEVDGSERIVRVVPRDAIPPGLPSSAGSEWAVFAPADVVVQVAEFEAWLARKGVRRPAPRPSAFEQPTRTADPDDRDPTNPQPFPVGS